MTYVIILSRPTNMRTIHTEEEKQRQAERRILDDFDASVKLVATLVAKNQARADARPHALESWVLWRGRNPLRPTR